MRLLVIARDRNQAYALKKALQAESYTVETAMEGEADMFSAEDLSYDLVVLDSAQVAGQPLRVLKHIRSNNTSVPILILLQGNRVEDRINGLDLGADDCLRKPFSFAEFSARIRALLRRRNVTRETVLRVGELELDWGYMRASRAGQPIELTRKEFSLLAYLMRNAGRPLTRQMILDRVWGMSIYPNTNVVDVFIWQLRRKVDEGFQYKLIPSIRGVGYVLRAPDSQRAVSVDRHKSAASFVESTVPP